MTDGDDRVFMLQPVTPKIWTVLHDDTIESLIDLYSPAVPLDVRVFFTERRYSAGLIRIFSFSRMILLNIPTAS